MITDRAHEDVVLRVRAADVAARAARAVHGVARLQPGVLGLLAQLAAQAAATGAMVTHAVTEVVPAVAGVRVDTIRAHIAEVEVDLV